MNILIAYGGKNGTTKECADILKERLEAKKNNVNTVDLNKFTPNINDYDTVIIGSNIRMGMINKKVKKYIDKTKEKLKNKKTGYYICCGFSENARQYFEANIDKDLLESSVVFDSFGGDISKQRNKGFDGFIVNIVSKTAKEGKEVKILDKNIYDFIEKISK